MKVSIAIAVCILVSLIVLIAPESQMVAATSNMWWRLRIAVAIAVLWDARRIHLREYATGLGKGGWVFWVVLIGWPVVGVPWYLTIRELITTEQLPRQSGPGQRIEAVV